MGRYLLLWLLGIPIPILLLIWVFGDSTERPAAFTGRDLTRAGGRRLRPPFAPMEALSVDEIPTGSGWQYEPKWDGVRCLLFRNGRNVVLQSKSGRSLTRYFPDLVEAALALKADVFRRRESWCHRTAHSRSTTCSNASIRRRVACKS
jgi:hypothetical protein